MSGQALIEVRGRALSLGGETVGCEGLKSRTDCRDVRLDALRGLLLVIMAAVHVPTPLSRVFQEPFGFISAAEGFVFLGACLAGRVFGKAYAQRGWREMARRAWKRGKELYCVHLGLLLPLALIAWAAGQRWQPLANHFHDFLLHPVSSLALMPVLMHQPPLFDILPLYIHMIWLTPFLFWMARRRGWGLAVSISGLLWLTAQFKLQTRLFGEPAQLLPFRFGAFDLLAWQFLWVSGLALGETSLRRSILSDEDRLRFGAAAGAIVVLGLLARHGFWPHAWLSPSIYLWMDKWTLGPLRLLNFGAWVVFLMGVNPRLPNLVSPLVLLGRNSLTVFAGHIPLAIAASASGPDDDLLNRNPGHSRPAGNRGVVPQLGGGSQTRPGGAEHADPRLTTSLSLFRNSAVHAVPGLAPAFRRFPRQTA